MSVPNPAAADARPEIVPVESLQETARRLRVDVVEMIAKAGSGHPGGSLSALDVILALYSGEMRFDPKEPKAAWRDRFVLSKGHGVPALYAVMAERGFFDRDELKGLRELGSSLQGHPANALLPGIEASTGSLGQGLSVAQGIALAGRLQGGENNPAYRVYALCGDGEIQEGQIWEAALSAPKLKLSNLCVFIDWNKAQIDGLVEDVMPLMPLREKWEAFGWNVLEIDGHDYTEIRQSLADARAETERPTVILAHTLKGKGAAYFESDIVGWHGKAPNAEETERVIQEINGKSPSTGDAK